VTDCEPRKPVLDAAAAAGLRRAWPAGVGSVRAPPEAEEHHSVRVCSKLHGVVPSAGAAMTWRDRAEAGIDRQRVLLPLPRAESGKFVAVLDHDDEEILPGFVAEICLVGEEVFTQVATGGADGNVRMPYGDRGDEGRNLGASQPLAAVAFRQHQHCRQVFVAGPVHALPPHANWNNKGSAIQASQATFNLAYHGSNSAGWPESGDRHTCFLATRKGRAAYDHDRSIEHVEPMAQPNSSGAHSVNRPEAMRTSAQSLLLRNQYSSILSSFSTQEASPFLSLYCNWRVLPVRASGSPPLPNRGNRRTNVPSTTAKSSCPR